MLEVYHKTTALTQPKHTEIIKQLAHSDFQDAKNFLIES